MINPTSVWFVDFSWGDCDDQHSTGCFIGMLQGGSIDHNSFVPDPIPFLPLKLKPMPPRLAS
jgi:hypothetical protein